MLVLHFWFDLTTVIGHQIAEASFSPILWFNKHYLLDADTA